MEVLLKLRDVSIDWIQEGFQDFFKKLDGYFLLLSGKNNSDNLGLDLLEGIPSDKITAGLVLVLTQLSLFIEQSAIPRIAEVSNHINYSLEDLFTQVGLGSVTLLIKSSGNNIFLFWRWGTRI